jgi:hypothetical protein
MSAGPTGPTGPTGAFPSHTGCAIPYVKELDPNLIKDCNIPPVADSIWQAPVFPPVLPTTKTTQPQVLYGITNESSCPQKAKQVNVDGSLTDTEESFECLGDGAEPKAIPVLTADGKTVLFRGGGGGTSSVLGVIKGGCFPGPVQWQRIQVFDDGSWVAIPEVPPTGASGPTGATGATGTTGPTGETFTGFLTGYILDRY